MPDQNTRRYSGGQACRVILKPDREKPVLQFHPWIFSGAIDRIDSEARKGDLVHVYSSHDRFLGIGYVNRDSQIAVRLLTFRDEPVDTDFFVRRFEAAKALRKMFVPDETTGFRFVHSEGDFLPGLAVDRYGEFLLVQFLTAGMFARKREITEALRRVFPAKGIFERPDPEAGRLEGFASEPQVLLGDAPPDRVEMTEGGARFLCDIRSGQKTGFFFDQRENRKLVASFARAARALDCFSYSGAFSVQLLKGGAAHVTAVEEQSEAVSLIRENQKLNGFDESACAVEQANVFDFLRKTEGGFDLIVLDPPAFCKHKTQIPQASRGYKDINLQAIKKLKPGGILFTSSCSSFIDSLLFQKIVFGAAKDAGREVQIIQKTSHAPDHPINLYHPEGEYLKGLLLRVL